MDILPAPIAGIQKDLPCAECVHYIVAVFIRDCVSGIVPFKARDTNIRGIVNVSNCRTGNRILNICVVALIPVVSNRDSCASGPGGGRIGCVNNGLVKSPYHSYIDAKVWNYQAARLAGYSNFGFGFRLHFIMRFDCFFNENVIVIFAEILDNRLLISGRDAFFGVCCSLHSCLLLI